MLDLKRFHDNIDDIKRGLLLRNLGEEELMKADRIASLDNDRKSLQAELDDLNYQRNVQSKLIGQLMKEGKSDEVEAAKSQVHTINDRIQQLSSEFTAVKDELQSLLHQLPNVPHPDVPPGKDDSDNVVIQDWTGTWPDLADDAQPHWELASKYDLIDMALGAKLAGSGFAVFKGAGARLQRALISYFLDRSTAAGYIEYVPPLLVNVDSATATGHLPDKEGQMYQMERDDLFLIPTSELPLANIFRDEILTEDQLPIKVTSYTPCFRREAGSYGAHVKGLNRLHQFDKVELVQIAHPQHSYESLDEMVSHVASLLDELQLPYRIVRLCGGDMGFASAMTYDFEVYSAAQKRWLEVSSVSNCEDFQANRLKLRIKSEGGNQMAHTLNGSALALPRIIAALLENNQSENQIRLPDVLHKYFGEEYLVHE